MPHDAQAAPPTQPASVSSQRVNRVRTLLGLPPLLQSAQPDTALHLDPGTISAQIEPAVPTVQPGWPNAGQAAEEAWIAEELAATVAEREAVMPSKSPANDQPAQPQRIQTPTPLPSRPVSNRPQTGEEEARTVEHPSSSHVAAGQTSIPSEQQGAAQADGLPPRAPDESELQRAAAAPRAVQPSAVTLTTIDIPGQVSQSTAAKQPDVPSSAPQPVSKPMPAAAQREQPGLTLVDIPGDAPTHLPVAGSGQPSLQPLPPLAASRLEMPLPSMPEQAITVPIVPMAELTSLASARPQLEGIAPTEADAHTKRLPAEEQAPPPTIPSLSASPPSAAAVVSTAQPADRAQAPNGHTAEIQRVSVQSGVAHERALPALKPSLPEQQAWRNRPAEWSNSAQGAHGVEALRKQIDALTAKVAGLEKAHQAPPPPAPPPVIVRNRRVPHSAETRAFWDRSYRGRARLRI